MPYSDPQSTHNPTTGQIIPASWGDIIRDDLEYLARNFPHCSIFESTAQSVATSTETDLTSNEERSDIGGMHSSVSNTERITVPSGEGGLYTIAAVVNFAANATGFRQLLFRVNNTTNYDAFALPNNGAGAATIFGTSRSLVLAAGDFVTCRVFQNSGGALNVTMLDFSVAWRAVA